MIPLKVGDLVKLKDERYPKLIQKIVSESSIGMVKEIRKKDTVAFIVWMNTSSEPMWVHFKYLQPISN